MPKKRKPAANAKAAKPQPASFDMRQLFPPALFPHAEERALDDAQAAAVRETLASRVPKACKFPSNEECVTYMDVFRAVQGSDALLVLKGGAVRDLVTGVAPRDVDVAYGGISKEDVIKRIKAMPGVMNYSFSSSVDVGYVLLGDRESGVGIDFFPLSASPRKFEAPCNALLLDFNRMVIWDPFGTGVRDAIDLVWRSPFEASPSDMDEWLSSSRLLLWRAAKFYARSYAIPDATLAALFAWWYEKRDEISSGEWRGAFDKNMLKWEDVGTVVGFLRGVADELHASGRLPVDGTAFLELCVIKGAFCPAWAPKTTAQAESAKRQEFMKAIRDH